MQLPIFKPESTWKPPKMADLPSWKNAKRIAVDIETRDDYLRELGIGVRRGGYIVGVAFGIEDHETFYLPIAHDDGDNLPKKAVLDYLKAQAKAFRGEIVGANLSYDLDYLFEAGIEFHEDCKFLDIQIADPLINELEFSYSLENISKRYGLPGKNEDLLEQAARDYGVSPKGGLWRLPARYVGAYAEDDINLPLMIMRRQERLIEEHDLERIWKLETAVLPVLIHMRRRGVLIDWDKLTEIEEWTLHKEAEFLKIVHDKSGYTLGAKDLWNARAMAPVFDKIGIKLNKTKTGQPQINADVFKNFDHPVVKALEKARKLNKLRTTFAASVRRYECGGRIHCTFNQIAQENVSGEVRGVRFGRLSAADPNMQQQPNPEKEPDIAGEWRKIYRAEPGALWASADYCFSDDTEVLTKDGFKLFKDLHPGLEWVAQWNRDTGEITYAKPIEYQRIPFRGGMVYVRGDRQIDMLMSPEHKCLLQNRSGDWYKVYAKDYLIRKGFQVQAGEYKGTYTENPDLLRVVVAIQADGSVRTNNYRIWLGKQRKVERLRKLLKKSGLEWHETHCDKKAAGHGFVIKKTGKIRQYLTEDKTFQRNTLMRLTAELRNVFLDELELWDGSTEGHYYCSTVKRNVEIVQHIGVLTNRRCNLVECSYPNRKPLWKVSLTKRYRTDMKSVKLTHIPYDGDMYCVTMPQGTVIVRRDGRVCINSQSQQEPRWTTHYAALLDLPKARDMAQAYHDNPDLDNHAFMKDLTGLTRTYAKFLYLGLCYGEGGAKLCQTLGLPIRWALSYGRYRERRVMHFETQNEAFEAQRGLSEAGRIWRAAGEKGQAIIDQFNERAPFINLLAKTAQKQAEKNGFIVTGGGRKLHFSRRGDGHGYDKVYKALNRLIQGTSADQMKAALVEIHKAGFFVNLQVHDEANASVANEKQAREIGEIMRTIMPALVPFKVDVETGPSWGAAA